MAKVSVQTGVPASVQETSYMNATLQSSGGIAFSIATHVQIPDHYVRAGQRAIGQYLQAVLEAYCPRCPTCKEPCACRKALDNVKFEVQIGKDDQYEPTGRGRKLRK